jgi:hypothetical protein
VLDPLVENVTHRSAGCRGSAGATLELDSNAMRVALATPDGPRDPSRTATVVADREDAHLPDARALLPSYETQMKASKTRLRRAVAAASTSLTDIRGIGVVTPLAAVTIAPSALSADRMSTALRAEDTPRVGCAAAEI